MSGLKLRLERLATVVTVAGILVGAASADAQITRRARRETNANRQARIARAVQDTYSHRWEVAGGGGFLRFRSGPVTQRNNEITWAASGTYFLHPKFGIEADARGSYGNAKVNNTLANIPNPQISQYFLMAGPSYRFYAKQKLAISVHGLGGVALGNFDGGTKGFPANTVGLWTTGQRPAFSVGLNFDYNIYPNVAFRITPTYVASLFSSGVVLDNGTDLRGTYLQNNKGINFQLVYRFGRVK